jgi:hypothetical protein
VESGPTYLPCFAVPSAVGYGGYGIARITYVSGFHFWRGKSANNKLGLYGSLFGTRKPLDSCRRPRRSFR